MGKTTGFLELQRIQEAAEPVPLRVRHYREFTLSLKDDEASRQGARCMDCGIPFCQTGCPVHNIIPDWNDLAYREQWQSALEVLHSTNNFPEFTGRVCPAPCEAACTLNINNDPVGIKSIEHFLIDKGWAEGWVVPQPPAAKTGKRVAVVGSGPAGMACAQQLARAGHDVVLFEKADRIGGLLRYGIPDFKMEKHLVDRRMAQMAEEGVEFRPNTNVGVDIAPATLLDEFDAVALTGGSEKPRDLPVAGRELAGIHFAVDYLTQQNRGCAQDEVPAEGLITAAGKDVVIIGGGDTGADCLGTAHRQGARSVRQLELLQRPPDARAPQNPWPTWPNIFRTSSAHEEGGERHYAIATDRFAGTADGRVARLHATELDTKAPIEFDADLVLLAMGFVGPERNGLISELEIALTERGTVARNADWMTNVPGVFATGDMQRGQSLIVWAIADGRSCARGVDAYLMGHSSLPAPVA